MTDYKTEELTLGGDERVVESIVLVSKSGERVSISKAAAVNSEFIRDVLAAGKLLPLAMRQSFMSLVCLQIQTPKR